MRRIILLVLMLSIGFTCGVVYSIYSIKVVNIEGGEDNALVTLELLKNKSYYYYEK